YMGIFFFPTSEKVSDLLNRAAEIKLADFRVLEYLTARACQPHGAVLHDDAVLAELEAGPRVLLDEQDGGAALVHLPGGTEHRLEHYGRQAHRRLVEQDQHRVEHQRAG